MRERNEALLTDLIATRAESTPDLDVLTFERWSLGDGALSDDVRTYATLRENANRIAYALVQRGLTGDAFRRGQRIACGGAAGFAAIDLFAQLRALRGKDFRRGTGICQFNFGGCLAFCQLFAALFGRFQTVTPAADFLGDFLTAAGATLALAAQFILARPLGHHRHARGFDG